MSEKSIIFVNNQNNLLMHTSDYTYSLKNKRIIENETGKEVLAKFNKHIVYLDKCTCCGKYSSVEYKGVQALNTIQIYGLQFMKH